MARVRVPSGERWLQAGAAVFGAGAAAAVSYWIYGLQAGRGHTFWSTPGFVAVAAATVGLLMLVVGLFQPGDRNGRPAQTQVGGAGSSNLQAGRDINVARDSDSTS